MTRQQHSTTNPPSASSNKGNDSIAVFVRVRPLTPKEQDEGLTHLEGLKLSSNDDDTAADDSNAVALESPLTGAVIDGFTGVLGQEACNRTVFERCFSERLNCVLRGGTASLFCYGYTGGGKTHTVVGYGREERGLFFLAAEQLLQDLNTTIGTQQQQQEAEETNEEERLFLRATACEIYLDQVYDLVGHEKRPCTIRVDSDDQLIIQGEPVSEQLDGMSEFIDEARKNNATNGLHSTLVTLAPGLSCIPIHEPHDLQALSQTCVTQRACGTSTTHNTSSRSHAILRLEVVSTAMNELRDELQRLEAELPALKNARDNGWCRRGYLASGRTRSDPVTQKEQEIVKCKTELDALVQNGPAALGGSMLLVDLAGADYDHRGGTAQKESTAINQSLLALKECFRALAAPSSSTQRPPFRRSKLTRILEDSLSPSNTSRRRNKETQSVMLVNVSPASNLKHGTMNALRYGQLFSKNGSGNNTTKSSDKTGSRRIAEFRKQAKENQAPTNSKVDSEVCKAELRKIYETCVPEKTPEDVESILHKFEGREQVLLEKVKAKYLVVDMSSMAAASS